MAIGELGRERWVRAILDCPGAARREDVENVMGWEAVSRKGTTERRGLAGLFQG